MTFVLQHSPFEPDSGPDAFAASPTLVVASGFGPAPDFNGMICYSADGGVTWTETLDHPFITGWPECLCRAEELDLWVAGGFSGFPDSTIVLATSTDALTWTGQVTDLDNDEVGAICWSPELSLLCAGGAGFLGVGGPASIITSLDGVTWTTAVTPIDGNFVSGLCWSPALGLFCAISIEGEVITSPDGVTWTLQTTPIDPGSGGEGTEVMWSPSQGFFVAFGQTDFSGPHIIIFSSDGVTWTTANFPEILNRTFSAMEINDGQIMADATTVGGGPRHQFLLSQNGTDWAETRAPFNNGFSVGYSPYLGYAFLGGLGSDSLFRSIATGTPSPIRRTPETDTNLWRYLITDLAGSGITDFSKVASNRVIEVVLNAPLVMRGQIASDSSQANIVYDTDGYNDSYLNEGTRLIWGLRRESNDPPFYVPRAAAICQLVQDAGQQDDAVTSFQGWDPWHYMFSRPVVDIDGKLPSQQPGKKGLSWDDTKVSVIICELLRNTILNHGHAYIDAGDGNRIGEGSQYQDWAGTFVYAGSLDDVPVIDWGIREDISVGQAWQELTNQGFCDIILNPIYDPYTRPNYLVEMNVLAQAGEFKPEEIFAWNMPGRSLVAVNRQLDGTGRANEIAIQAGQGGKFGGSRPFPVEDPDSAAKYGEYWAMQSFPEIVGPAAVVSVTSLAEEMLRLRKDGRETVTFTPAPERSPRPWQDYDLGDRVSTWAAAQGFRQLLGAATFGTGPPEREYQRIYGWTANISDDALETIDPVLVSPGAAE